MSKFSSHSKDPWLLSISLLIGAGVSTPAFAGGIIPFLFMPLPQQQAGQTCTTLPAGTIGTWISGSSTINQRGTYGTKGVSSASNVPGARLNAVTWTDASGNFWLFGGTGYDSAASNGYLNDLWKWNGSQWTWVSGSNIAGQSGTYGTQGVPSASNVPGARIGAVSWTDSSGNFWLFGGNGPTGYLNDLWKWDGSQWTWVSGSNAGNQSGTYGTQGVPSASNVPGGKEGAVSWVDSSGNFWLFGGYGYDSPSHTNQSNDLWKWDGSQWTWVSGSNAGGQNGTYGTQGTPAPSNVPGARWDATGSVDSSGNFWLFGGDGYDSAAGSGSLNDLWKWDGSQWTWVSGSNIAGQSGTYGTQGLPSAPNVPGARSQVGASWIDSSGNFWLFGGETYDPVNFVQVYQNDLWKWDGSQWAWVSGSNAGDQGGTYGTKGTASASNMPGGRRLPSHWVDSSGNLWIFGGDSYDSTSTEGVINDLWKLSLVSGPAVCASSAKSSITASPSSLAADGSTTTTLTITLKNGSGSPVVGAAPLISTSGSGNTLVQPTVSTDASGKTTATLKSTMPQTEAVTISFPALTTSTTVTFTPTQLALSGSATPPVNTCTAYTVSATGATGTAGNPSSVTVNLSGNGNGAFYSDSGCSSSVTSVSIPVNAGSTTFYFKDATYEVLTLTAADAAGVLTSATLSVAIYQTCQTFLTSGTSWTVPAHWNNSSNRVEVLSGGGGGASGTASKVGGGGGGGSYSDSINVTLTPGAMVTYAVGTGGTAGVAGGNSYFCNSTSNCASVTGAAVVAGAIGGGAGTTSSAGAGSTAGATGTGLMNSGGNGFYVSGAGGGGGGAAGAFGVGGSAVNASGGTGDNSLGGSAGSPGTEWNASYGSGGGGNGGGTTTTGGNGGNYGGGGGGGYKGMAGGAGAPGVIVITFQNTACN